MFKINFLQLFRVNLIKQDVEIFSARSQCKKTKKKIQKIICHEQNFKLLTLN